MMRQKIRKMPAYQLNIDVRTNEYYQNVHPFGSPTLSDQALMPFPSLKLGPGESSRSHSADEFICLSEIEQAIEKYILLIRD